MTSRSQQQPPADAIKLPDEVYFQTMAQAPVAICITDSAARILYTNVAFSELTGYESSEVNGQHTRMLSAGKTPACIYDGLWRTILEQRSWCGQMVNRRKNGSSYLAELTITPVIGADGTTSHYLAMHRDVTRLQQLDRDLDNQRTLTETLMVHSPVATVLLGDDGQIWFENPALKRICLSLGCNRDHLLSVLSNRLGQPLASQRQFADLKLRYDIPGIATPRWLVCSGGAMQLWHHDDSYTKKQAIYCLLITINDVTDLKTQQEEVRINALMARLAEDELSHSMREALSGTIFQLQRPLNMIDAATAIQKKRSPHNDSLVAALEDVSIYCHQAIETLGQAMPAQIRRGHMPLNLNELLREVLSLYTIRLLADGVIVDWRPCTVLPSILGDDIALCNLFKQLLDNALDAMSEARTRDRNLQLVTERIDDSVRVQIVDSGPGIADDIRNRIFEPFFSANKLKCSKGGMGLVMARDVANDHGAVIDVANNREYQGCCFTLIFPLLSTGEGAFR